MHVGGRMIDLIKDAGANVVNSDCIWHYTEGLAKWNAISPNDWHLYTPMPIFFMVGCYWQALGSVPLPCL